MPRQVKIKIADEYAHHKGNSYFRREWAGFAVEYVRLSGRQEYEFRIPASGNYVALLDIERLDGETTFDSIGHSTRLDLNSTMSFLPVGAQAKGWSVIEGDHTFTAVHLDPDKGEAASSVLDRLRPAPYFSSATILKTMQKLGAVASGEFPGDALYVETLAKLLEMELASFLTGRTYKPPGTASLTSRQLDSVVGLIEERLAEDLSLSELAAVVGFSRFHFLRAFKQSTGETPHQYVLRRRIETAKALLEGAKIPIQDVAARVGFSNPEHFSRTFQRRVGISARDYQKKFR